MLKREINIKKTGIPGALMEEIKVFHSELQDLQKHHKK